MDEANEFPGTESLAPKPSGRLLKRPAWLFGIAAVIALIVFGLYASEEHIYFPGMSCAEVEG
jgi:hypothetical protein